MASNQSFDIQPPPDYWKKNFLEETMIAVPIRNSDGDVVELQLDNLPDKNEIVDILKNEEPPIKTWNIIALHCHARDNEDNFVDILREAMEQVQRYPNRETPDAAFCMDLMANYYTTELTKDKYSEKEKKEMFGKAMRLYSSVDQLMVTSLYHLIGRAYFCLLDPEKLDQAATQFDYVLKSFPNDYLALQGRGLMAFQKADYKKALVCFKNILRAHPDCSPEIRMAIGHCLFKLGRHERARLAYERALQLDSLCTGAMVGLALIFLNENTDASVQTAMQHIVRVYKIDQMQPINLNLLAEHFFYRRETNKALPLAMMAIQKSKSEHLKAESVYIAGKCHHYDGNYDQAFQFYYQATQFAKASFVLPHYGLGQMYLQRNDVANAVLSFEKVLAVSPGNVETLKILGILYLQMGTKEKKNQAKNYLKRVCEARPDDIDAHIKFAELQETLDPEGALNTYRRVIEIYRERSSQNDLIPPELLNNISVLDFQLGKIEESRKYLDWAIARAVQEQETSENDQHYKHIQTTMAYNKGRLAEAERDHDEAQKCYKGIVVEHPNYVDCYLRVGCLSRDRGNILEASDWFKEAGSVNPDHPDSHLLLGNLHMSKGEYGPAQKKYEKVLSNQKSKNDTYALLSLANIWLETLYTPIDQDKKRRHSERAFQLYKQVLKIDPSNVYAVNGMGAVLAHTRQLEEAKEMFSVVRESTADILDLWINIGNLYCDQRQFVAGIKMYENALKRFPTAALDPQVFLYLARAQCLSGDLPAARKTLQQARVLAPQNQQLRFNLGLVLHKMAVNTLKDFRSSKEVKGAKEDLQTAQAIFEFLSTEGDKAVVDMHRAAKLAKLCNDYLTQAQNAEVRATQVDEEDRLLKEKIEQARLEYQQRHVEEEQKLMDEKLRQQVELRRKREEVLAKTAEVKDRIMKQENEPEVKVKSRARKRAAMEDELFIDDEGNYTTEAIGPDGQPRAKRPRADGGSRRGEKKRARRERRERERETGMIYSSGGEEEGEAGAVEPTRATREPEYDRKGRKYKTKAIISDTESSSSDDDEEGSGKSPDKDGEGDKSNDEGQQSSKPARKALVSSDEEDDKPEKKGKSDDEEEPAEREQKPSPKKNKAALRSDDEEDMDVDHDQKGKEGGEEEEDATAGRPSKLSINDSDDE